MSGCETPIKVHVWQPEGGGWVDCAGDECALCDHGEDDPCCAEPTEPPTDDEAA